MSWPRLAVLIHSLGPEVQLLIQAIALKKDPKMSRIAGKTSKTDGKTSNVAEKTAKIAVKTSKIALKKRQK